MVPDSSDDADERSASEPERTHGERPTASDGGTDLGFDPDALYRVVRTAVKDALLDVIGTLLLLGVALVLVVAGGQLLVGGMSGATSGVMVGVGAVVALFGLSVAATALDLLPPVAEWV
jgi:hypothetical protein